MSAMSLSGCLVGRKIQNGGMLSDSKFQFLNPSPDTAHPVPETRGVNQGLAGALSDRAAVGLALPRLKGNLSRKRLRSKSGHDPSLNSKLNFLVSTVILGR
jgi:hypothetical protein